MQVHHPVTVYQHVQSNYDHSTLDMFAIVLRELDNGDLKVVAFPEDGPVQFLIVHQFDEDEVAPGGIYWREMDSAPPDFSGLDYTGQPEWNALVLRQKAQVENVNNPEDREKLLAQHREEREKLRVELDKKFQRQRGQVEEAEDA